MKNEPPRIIEDKLKMLVDDTKNTNNFLCTILHSEKEMTDFTANELYEMLDTVRFLHARAAYMESQLSFLEHRTRTHIKLMNEAL